MKRRSAAERRSIAAELIMGAAIGLTREQLIEAVKTDHPHATDEAIMRGAFFAASRREIEERTIPTIYEVGVLLRRNLPPDPWW